MNEETEEGNRHRGETEQAGIAAPAAQARTSAHFSLHNRATQGLLLMPAQHRGQVGQGLIN
jgi:hypothetical protein